MSELGDFEGIPVLKTSISITKAGDGLSKALGVDPAIYRIGDRLRVLLDCVVESVEFDPIPDVDGRTRKHVLAAGAATIVDQTFGQVELEAQAARIEQARVAAQREKDEAAGNVSLTDQTTGESIDPRPTKAQLAAQAAQNAASENTADGFHDSAETDKAVEYFGGTPGDAADRAGVPATGLKAITGGRASKAGGRSSNTTAAKKGPKT